MTAYARTWTVVAILLGVLGSTEAVLAVAPSTAVAFSALGATAAVCSLRCPALFRQDPPPTDPRSVVLALGVGGVVGIALTGLVVLLGAGMLVLVLLLAVAHPRLVTRAARQARRRLDPAQPVGLTRGRGPVLGGPAARVAVLRAEPTTNVADQGWPDAVALQGLSTSELCWGWRASFTALDRSDAQGDRARCVALVAVRQSYLDEIARRDPAGFSRWLYRGARPASDPSPYLRSPSLKATTHRPPTPAVPAGAEPVPLAGDPDPTDTGGHHA